MVRGGKPDRRVNGELLGELALAVDRARPASDAEFEGSTHDIWCDLLAGRLRVVTRFDREGRRFVVVRKTHGPTQSGLSPLTAREIAVIERRVRGAQLKSIATALGVSTSTVAKSLQRALFKLGLEKQADLVAVFGGGATAGPNPTLRQPPSQVHREKK